VPDHHDGVAEGGLGVHVLAVLGIHLVHARREAERPRQEVEVAVTSST
jgi:hypothetical protein